MAGLTATSVLPGRVVWLTVESGDNPRGNFWACVPEALRHRGVALPDVIGVPARPDEVDDSLLSRLAAYLNGLTEPLLPLHRYRAAGEVTDIRAADLAFRPEETAEPARRHGLALSDQTVRTLAERTSGWAAGLQLCILAARRAGDPETFLEKVETEQSTTQAGAGAAAHRTGTMRSPGAGAAVA